MPLPKMQAAYAQSAAGLDGRGRPGTRRQPGKAVYRCANTARCRATGPACDTVAAARAAALRAGYLDRLGKLYCPTCYGKLFGAE